ncbi:hypothetical protein BDY19DRAFT_987985 [Irpex rosettiformis]|uniref:Uncharacterized protein n=1 Tax=Irpex rosettiformis TaxID=378272 RepID=A0ACB8TLZ6_9APHY|nr:hypothetical protein BDY19DRAFT_987985 [Irpex rosettiformis]
MDINMEGNENDEWEFIKADVDELGIHETLVDAIHHMSHWNGQLRRVGQVKTWRSRRTRQEEAWGKVLDIVIQEYITWRYRPSAQPDRNGPNQRGNHGEAEPREDEGHVEAEPLNASEYLYTVAVFNLDTLDNSLTVRRRADSMSPAFDLMRHGYIAKSPSKPTVAVSATTLELLYRLRQRKPSYSIEAFAKTVCDKYNIPYRRHVREIFADTFEVFLRIMRSVHRMIYTALGWDGPDWRVKNACVACCYKLEDEPELRFGRLLAMDGNNSLKRIATTAHRTAADTRILDDSDYFLPTDFVNRYANEVKGRSSKGPAVRRKADNSDTESDDDSRSVVAEGDPTDGLRPNENTVPNDLHKARRQRLAQCTKNWKSAAKEDRKKMWGMFDEAGVFAAACRHGLILWVIDMVCSGELAKYPLAIVSKTLELLGERPLIGYNVGCSFDTTTEKSSLDPPFVASGGQFCVCAFHGYSHSFACQLEYHPNIIAGAGLEDLETMERIFSITNGLASVTRYASPYRRRLFIEAFLRQIDEDKYLNTGTFILNNYKQALSIVHDDASRLAEAMDSLGITEEDLDNFEKEQMEFFSQLGEEDPEDLHAVAYVERLEQLKQLNTERVQTNSQFLNFVSFEGGSQYTKDLKATRRAESDRRHANERYERVYQDVCELEMRMGIGARWIPTTPEYQSAIKYIKERKYHRALSKLQKLVTQRLFELQRLNVAQTGYKMRAHITKSLQTRCKSIQQAIASYNTAAAALDPPRPSLNWTEVGSYNFLEQFALLQDTRHDIRGKRWIESAVRECMKKRHRIRRAREEIIRLKVEVRRLHTSIRDERILFREIQTCLRDAGDPILGAVQDFIERRQRFNDELLLRVYQVYSLFDVNDVKGPGTRLGSVPLEGGDDNRPDDAIVDNDQLADEEVDVLEGDEEQEALGNLVEFLSTLNN